MDKIPLFEQIIDELVTDKFAVVNSFFTDEELVLFRENLLQKFENQTFKKASIGTGTSKQIIEDIRGDYILWIDETQSCPTEQLFFSKVNAFINYLNSTCYVGVNETEFFYALYPEGSFYKTHYDNFKTQNSRKFTFLVYLNQHWQPEHQGELVVYPPEKAITITPTFGKVVIFDGTALPHEVFPTTHKRLSITGWLKG